MNISEHNDMAIKFSNVSKSFTIGNVGKSTFFDFLIGKFNNKDSNQKLEILKNISFEIKSGEFFGIVGKNGVGKSTILKLISNILLPNSGTIETNGKIVPLIELGVGFQPENTAQENIRMYGMILGFSRNEIDKKIDNILEFAELENFANTKIKNFSSGMFSRLAFSTAIQVNPDILLVDEVLSVGDIAFQKKSYDAFLSFKQKKKTIILVTQNMDYIKNLCDRAMFVSDGKIVCLGDPEKVVDEYIKKTLD